MAGAQNVARAPCSNFAVRFSLFIASILLFSPLARAQTAAPATAPIGLSKPQIWDFSAPKPDPKNLEFASPFAAPGGVATSVAIELKAGALRFTNRAGGSFGLKLNVAPFDATRFPTLDLNFTRSPDTKINFFFKVNGSYYGVVFSGPPRVRAGSFLLGTVPNVGTKGRVILPLRDWLRRFQPKAEKLQVEEVLVGNWDNEGYLLAGIGGNGPGATWSLSRFALVPAKTTAPQWETARFEGNRLIWPLESGTFDSSSAVLSIDSAKFGFESPFLRFETTLEPQNTLAQRVVFEAGDAGLNFSDGQKLQLGLAGTAQTLAWKLGAHLANVPLPRLNWEGAAPLSLDFESGASGVEAASAIVEVDPAIAASGQNSLKFFNPRTASPFDAGFRPASLDAAQFPFVTFAYRHDSRLRLDFRLRWDDKNYFIKFTDRDGAQTKLGEIADIPDEKWHYATLPLLDWMKKARPDATKFVLDDLRVSDDAWLGNARGVTWNLDDFRAAPLLTTSLKASATLRDVSGVKAVSYLIDQNPQAEVDSSPEGGPNLDISLAGRAAGLYFLHLRAQNGAGNWSDAAHFSFAVK